MIRLLAIFIVLTFLSCGQTSQKHNSTSISVDTRKLEMNLKPFELTVFDADYSMAHALQYVLTHKELKIIIKVGLEREKDSTVFKTDLRPSYALNKLSKINIDNLKEIYSNPCIKDGSQVTVKLKKDHKSKSINLA